MKAKVPLLIILRRNIDVGCGKAGRAGKNRSVRGIAQKSIEHRDALRERRSGSHLPEADRVEAFAVIELPVPAANDEFRTAERIPGKTDPRSQPLLMVLLILGGIHQAI